MQPLPAGFDAHAFFVGFLGETTPERRSDLEDILRTQNIRFVLDEASPGIDFWAHPSTGQINVPRRCLFRMKASAYAYYSAVSGLLAKRRGDSTPDTDRQLKKASELLTWAVRTDVATTLGDKSSYSLGEIPAGIESLYTECLGSDQLGVGEHVFRLSVAWVLHHELAHLRLLHTAPSVHIEYEADHAAIDWLLKGVALSEAERLARYFGICTGLGWLSALNVYIGPGSGKTHPPAAERFFKGVEYLALGLGEEAELPWAICHTVFLLHAQNAGFPVQPSDMAGSFKDSAGNLLNVIAKAKP